MSEHVVDSAARAAALAVDDALLDAWNRHAVHEMRALFTEDAVMEFPTLPRGPARGREEIEAELRGQFRAFPDMTLTCLERWVSDDGRTLAVYWSLAATFDGPLDPPGFAPTGRPVTATGMTRIVVADGRIADMRVHFDLNALGRTIGAVPQPGSFGERLGVRLQRMGARRGRPKR